MNIHFCVAGFFIALTIALVSSAEGPTSTNSHLSQANKARLREIIEPGFAAQDAAALHYAVLGFKLMDFSHSKTAEICKLLLKHAGDGTNLTPENAYYISSTWNTLATCQPLPVAAMTKALTVIVEKASTPIPDLYFAVSSLTALSQKLTPKTIDAVSKNIQASKKDDLLSLGYTLHIAAELGSAGSFALKHVEDLIMQADEVDGRFLQFEGGLSVTSLVVNGIYKLSSKMNQKPPLSTQQVVKFANYFLSRLTVQLPKGVVGLLTSLKVLATNEFEKPICIALAENGIVSTRQHFLEIRVCDILGKPLPSVPGVYAESTGQILEKKMELLPSPSDKTLFTLNLMELKPERGFYTINVSTGSAKNTVSIKVLSEIVVDYLEIGTADADQTTQPKLQRVAYPKTLSGIIEADYQQKLVMRFLLKIGTSKKSVRVHQAFVRLTPVDSDAGDEVIFVAEPDASHVYKFDMPVGTEGKNFGYHSGEYNVEVIIGDALLENSFQWNVGIVRFKFPEQSTSKSAAKPSFSRQKTNVYAPQSEIRHMFREPEKRPPVLVSNLFTGLCLAPVLLLLIIWAKLGVNVSNFPISLSAVAFHVGLASIFLLFGIFWLKLNMFVTLRYLIGLGIVTFFAGNKLLSHMAQMHKVTSR